MGKWYILDKYQLSPLPKTIDTVIMELKKSITDDSITFVSSFLANGTLERTVAGTVVLVQPDEGKLEFSYKTDGRDFKQPVTVLITDYHQYALNWLCVEHSNGTIEGVDLSLEVFKWCCYQFNVF